MEVRSHQHRKKKDKRGTQSSCGGTLKQLYRGTNSNSVRCHHQHL